MKTVGQLITTPRIVAAPAESVARVVERLRAHDISGMAVTEGNLLIGIVTFRDLIGQPLDREIREVMTRDVVTVAPDESITAAYALMDARRIGRLPIVDGGVLVGLVTRSDLLRELGKLTDPLTELPWAGTMRQRAAELLKAGIEITILFVDLDGFGPVNKRYGHVVGDHMIKAVAAVLLGRTDPQTDLVCRYAGDEFAIVTTRPAASSNMLADELRTAISAVAVPPAPAGTISAALGIAGGSRAAPRPGTHYDANVDDLITMASRASTAAKRTDRHVVHGHDLARRARDWDRSHPERRLAIRRIDVGTHEGQGRAIVELEDEGVRVQGEAAGSILGMGDVRLVVEATVTAIRQLLPPGWQVRMEEVARTTLQSKEAMTILLVVGTPQRLEHLIGSALTDSDPYQAAARATMKAVNRLLSRILPAQA